MRKYRNTLLLIAGIAAISIMLYGIIVLGYPYENEDRTDAYYNAILIVKAIIISANIIADAIILAAAGNNKIAKR